MLEVYIVMKSAGFPETSLHIYQTAIHRISQNYNFVWFLQQNPPSSSAEFKKRVELYLYTPLLPGLRGLLQGEHYLLNFNNMSWPETYRAD